jgi:hypothetical protein
MGGTGTCTACGAEEIEINDDEMCADCAKNDGADFKGNDDEMDMNLGMDDGDES